MNGQKLIAIDADHLYEGENPGILIVCAPTGILYSVQAGGISCNHPSAEGFVLPLWNLIDIDDCAYGCSYIEKCWNRTELDKPELRQALANDIDKALMSAFNGKYKCGFTIRFDFYRIDELMEGWWPVRITGQLHPCDSILDHQAYLHTGNCD